MTRRQLIFVVLFWAAAVFAVTMALLPKPPRIETLDQFGDKFEHMLAFATLSLLAVWAFPYASLWRIGERLSFLGALIEVCQSIPALHRDCDIRDWFADTAAIAVTLLLVQAWRTARGDAAKRRIDLSRGGGVKAAARAPDRGGPAGKAASGSPRPKPRAR